MNEQDALNDAIKRHGPTIGEPTTTPTENLLGNPDGGSNRSYTLKDGTKISFKTDKNGVVSQSGYNVSAAYIDAIGATKGKSVETYTDGDGNVWYKDDQGGFHPFGMPNSASEDRAATRASTAAAQAESERHNKAAEGHQTYEEGREAYSDYVNSINERSKAEATRINQLIEQNKMNLEQGKDEYSRWTQENVITPLKVAEEQRARAADERAVQQEQRRREEAAATDTKDTQKFAFDKGQEAIKNEMDLLPYAVGPKFTEQFAQAVNGVGKGKAYKGWTPEAFNINTPNLDQVFDQHVAKALSAISPYAARLADAHANAAVTGVPLTRTSYTGAPIPGAPGSAPPPGMPTLAPLNIKDPNLPDALPNPGYPSQDVPNYGGPSPADDPYVSQP